MADEIVTYVARVTKFVVCYPVHVFVKSNTAYAVDELRKCYSVVCCGLFHLEVIHNFFFGGSINRCACILIEFVPVR